MCNPRHPMMLKATEEELKTLIPDPAKGIMSVGILRWAMDEVESNDPGQRARWAKYKLARATHERLDVTVAPTTIVLEDDEEEEW